MNGKAGIIILGYFIIIIAMVVMFGTGGGEKFEEVTAAKEKAVEIKAEASHAKIEMAGDESVKVEKTEIGHAEAEKDVTAMKCPATEAEKAQYKKYFATEGAKDKSPKCLAAKDAKDKAPKCLAVKDAEDKAPKCLAVKDAEDKAPKCLAVKDTKNMARKCPAIKIEKAKKKHKVPSHKMAPHKPSPDGVIKMLKQGNQRFFSGNCTHSNTDSARLIQAGSENQGDHAYATVITCSDSRVPVERIFDAGVMDLFVVRVAGNVCDVDEAGSIEYGLSHVHTPVLVVLGHTQCGAVTAVTHSLMGKGHPLERNIPPLVDNIIPAVSKVMDGNKGAGAAKIIPLAIEQNVWRGIEDLFMASPSTRKLVKSGKAKVVGAIYDVGTGRIKWLDPSKTDKILKFVEVNPERAMKAMAEK
ncbi:carbonic anhydrase [Desulfobacterales bacterium HSG16]|nr:carbonic anhydrase [Desulfobacterales bacterium HSG16]